jgi:hypothetical protein
MGGWVSVCERAHPYTAGAEPVPGSGPEAAEVLSDGDVGSDGSAAGSLGSVYSVHDSDDDGASVRGFGGYGARAEDQDEHLARGGGRAGAAVGASARCWCWLLVTTLLPL